MTFQDLRSVGQKKNYFKIKLAILDIFIYLTGPHTSIAESSQLEEINSSNFDAIKASVPKF